MPPGWRYFNMGLTMNQLQIPVQRVVEAQSQEILRLILENVQLKAALTELTSPKTEAAPTVPAEDKTT